MEPMPAQPDQSAADAPFTDNCNPAKFNQTEVSCTITSMDTNIT